MDNDSILTSIKKLLGITEGYKHFDTDLVIHINSVIFVLSQLGIESADGFAITGAEETWSDLIPDSEDQKKYLESVKSYIYLKVRLLFDPPSASAVIESTKNLISELEWRINVAVDPKKTEEVTT